MNYSAEGGEVGSRLKERKKHLRRGGSSPDVYHVPFGRAKAPADTEFEVARSYLGREVLCSRGENVVVRRKGVEARGGRGGGSEKGAGNSSGCCRYSSYREA